MALTDKADAWENALLLLLFNNTNCAAVGDATGLRGSTTAGSLYISLHTAAPGETGNQGTSECTYTSYARTGVARAVGPPGWTVTGNSVSPTAAVNCATSGAGTGNTITHVGIGTDVSGTAGKLLYSGALTPNIVTGTGGGVTPQLLATSSVLED